MNLLSQITIQIVGGTEQSCAELNLTDPTVQLRNAQASLFTVKHAGARYDAAPLFDYGDEVIVRIGRNKANAAAAYAGGSVVFVGKRINATGTLRSAVDDYDYLFANVWWDLERLTFMQRWAKRSIVGTPPVVETSYYYSGKLTLPTAVDEVANVLEPITNGQQIREVINWAIAKGKRIQVGNITPSLFLLTDQYLFQKCSMVIQAMLKMNPDAVCEIDMTTLDGDGNPLPTFNCVERPFMTDVVWDLSRTPHELNITRREDLRAGSVVIEYDRVDSLDGHTRVIEPIIDRWPADADGSEDNAVNHVIQLFGARKAFLRGTIDSEVAPTLADLTSTAFWLNHGDATFFDAVTDVTITPDGLPTELPFILLPGSGGIAPWMVDDDGNDPESETVEYTALATFTDSQGQKVVNHRLKVKLKATNLGPGDYELLTANEAGETPPVGLAKQIYDILNTLHHDGDVSVTEAECGTDLRLINTLSIASSGGRYAAMKAIVQSINMNLATGQRSVSIGWPKHLSTDDMIEMGRQNRERTATVSHEVQASGDMSSDGDLTLPDHSAIEDNANGTPKFQIFQVDGPTAGATLKLNSTNGSFLMTAKGALNSQIEMSAFGGHAKILLSKTPGTGAQILIDTLGLPDNVVVQMRALTVYNASCQPKTRYFLCSDEF